MKRKDSPARKLMKLLCGFLGLVFAVMLAGTLTFRHYLNQINYIPQEEPEPQSILEVFSGIPLGNSGDGLIGGPGSELVNILLIGQDAREGETQARSDSMILCTYSKRTRELTMTSFLRDLYVPIPDHGSNRINASYSFGGAPLLKQTIRQNFGVSIDGCVEVDFSRFSEIIDYLGGVEIELRRDEANVINQQTGSALTEGIYRLDGFQALTYARIRSLDSDGDFSRTDRQRKVINALTDSLRGSSITELTSLISRILPIITTDLTRGQILLYALEILPHLSDMDIHSQRIPADGTYSGKMVDGMSVLVPDMEAQRQHLRDTLLR